MAENKKFCRKCGKEVSSNAKFCPGCGTMFTMPSNNGAASGASNNTAYAPAPAPVTSCPQCGAPLNENAKFCRHCGFRHPQGATTGPSMGASSSNIGQRPAQQYTNNAQANTASAYSTQQPAGTYQNQSQTGAPQGAAYSTPGQSSARPYQEQAQPAYSGTSNTAYPSTKRNPGTKKSQGIQKPSRRKKSPLPAIIAILLVACLLFTGLFKPGFFKPEFWKNIKGSEKETTADVKGLSSIKPSNKDYKIKPETADVSIENPSVKLESGVSVDFGTGNLVGEEQLNVISMGTKSDDEFEAELYDFDMGDSNKFPLLVEIKLPYDKSWGDNVFVQYYNEATKQWEIIWSEVTKTGEAVFWTDHFSTFAVFKEMVEKGGSEVEAAANSPIYKPRDSRMTLLTQCELDYAALAYDLRSRKINVNALSTDVTGTRGVQSAIDTFNNTNTFGTTILDAADLASGTSVFGSLTQKIGILGNVLTIGKIIVQMSESDSILEVLKNNSTDIMSMAVSITGTVAGGTTATVCSAIALSLFTYGLTTSYISSASLMGGANETDFGYRYFTANYLTYHTSTNQIGVKYGKTEYEKVSQLWMADELSLRVSEADYGQWMMAFDYLFKKYENSPEKFLPAIENLIDAYCTAFWKLEDAGSDVYYRYLKEGKAGRVSLDSLESKYKKPTQSEREEYTAYFKRDLVGWLSPLVQEYAKKATNQMLTLALQSAVALEHDLNETVTFQLVDRAPNNKLALGAVGKTKFTAPEKNFPIYMRQFRFDKDMWKFTEDNNYTITCTKYMYMMAGMPKYIDIYKSKDNYQAVKMNITFPNTYITFEESEFPTLEEIVGTYNGAVEVGAVEMAGWLTDVLDSNGLGGIMDVNTNNVYDETFVVKKTGTGTGRFSTPSEDLFGDFTYNDNTGEMKITIKDENGQNLKGTLNYKYSQSREYIEMAGSVSGTLYGVVKASLNFSGINYEPGAASVSNDSDINWNQDDSGYGGSGGNTEDDWYTEYENSQNNKNKIDWDQAF
ncbi:MAG: zinc ribbon domain-containing protein [Eubacteriales bacterium]|nr:zinc ribbon domain-containing protein [Eubacteriales bacterium]